MLVKRVTCRWQKSSTIQGHSPIQSEVRVESKVYLERRLHLVDVHHTFISVCQYIDIDSRVRGMSRLFTAKLRPHTLRRFQGSSEAMCMYMYCKLSTRYRHEPIR